MRSLVVAALVLPGLVVLPAAATGDRESEPVAQELDSRTVQQQREEKTALGPQVVDAPRNVRERLFVLTTPVGEGRSAIVAFDIDADGTPVQRGTIETGIVQDRLFGNQEPAVDPEGQFLFVPGGLADVIAVYAIEPDGTLIEIPESPFAAPLGSFQLAVHPSGRFLYNSQGLRDIHVYEILDGGVLLLRQTVQFRGSRDVEVSADGSFLYVTEGFDGLRGFEIDESGLLTEVPGSPYRSFPLNRPFEVELAARGDLLFILDLDRGVSVFRIGNDGSLELVPGSPHPTGEFSRNLESTSDDRHLYVAAAVGPRIHGFRLEPDDTLSPIPGSPFVSDSGPVELIHPPGSDRLYMVTTSRRISRYDIREDGTLVAVGAPTLIGDPLPRQPNGAVLLTLSTNSAPTADAGEDGAVECTSVVGTTVLLDGTASTDPDSTPGTNDDIVSFEWFDSFETSDEVFLGQGEMLSVSLLPGDHLVTLRVTDRAGSTDTDEVVKSVVDTTPPSVRVSLEPTRLWPPDHRMVEVSASVVADDACGSVNVTLSSIVSNEPDNGTGDANTEPDVDEAVLGTPDHEFRLRAERSGVRDGRAYTVRYRATDASGNEAHAQANVRVLHDQGNPR